MFRARIIENQKYYNFRRKQLLFLTLTIIPAGFLANYFELPVWAGVLGILGYIAALFLQLRNQKQLGASAGDSWLEIDKSTIKIKAKNGHLKETIKLDDVKQIILQENYSLPQDSLKAVKEEILGDPQKNLIVFQLEDGDKQLNFEVDSHYNLVQLQDLIAFWQAQGYLGEQVAA